MPHEALIVPGRSAPALWIPDLEDVQSFMAPGNKER